MDAYPSKLRARSVRHTKKAGGVKPPLQVQILRCAQGDEYARFVIGRWGRVVARRTASESGPYRKALVGAGEGEEAGVGVVWIGDGCETEA